MLMLLGSGALRKALFYQGFKLGIAGNAAAFCAVALLDVYLNL
jgi:hypothetical protein